MVRHIRRSSLSENSRPAVNSSSATPISASSSTSSADVITPIPAGPAITPAAISATIDGTRSRRADQQQHDRQGIDEDELLQKAVWRHGRTLQDENARDSNVAAPISTARENVPQGRPCART